MLKHLITITTITLLLILASCKENRIDGVDETAINDAEINNEIISPADERFREIDYSVIHSLNEIIEENQIFSELAVLQLYRPVEAQEEGNYSFHMTRTQLNENTFEITLTEEGLLDDSVEGQITKMIINNATGKITVLAIREAYKCKPGRGQQYWSPALCN